MSDPSNAEIVIRRASEGDPQALAAAFQLVRNRLKRVVQMRLDHRLWGRLDPSDVVQETFLDANRRLHEFTAQSKMPLLLWFRLLIGQRLVDLHRRHLGTQMRDARLEFSIEQMGLPQTSSVWLADQLLALQESPSAGLVREETRDRLHAALAEMLPVDREVLALRHFEACSNQEVADMLGLTKSAASNRYIRALARLKNILTAVP